MILTVILGLLALAGWTLAFAKASQTFDLRSANTNLKSRLKVTEQERDRAQKTAHANQTAFEGLNEKWLAVPAAGKATAEAKLKAKAETARLARAAEEAARQAAARARRETEAAARAARPRSTSSRRSSSTSSSGYSGFSTYGGYSDSSSSCSDGGGGGGGCD